MTFALRIAEDRAASAVLEAARLAAKLSAANQEIGGLKYERDQARSRAMEHAIRIDLLEKEKRALEARIDDLERELAIERGEIKTREYYQESNDENDSDDDEH